MLCVDSLPNICSQVDDRSPKPNRTTSYTLTRRWLDGRKKPTKLFLLLNIIKRYNSRFALERAPSVIRFPCCGSLKIQY